MNDNVIQTQLKLVSFKAVKAEFHCDTPEKGAKHLFELKLNDLLFPDNARWFAKVFLIDLVVPSGLSGEIVHYRVEYHTVFECSHDLDEKFLNSDFAKISAPAIGFPYVRAFISSISVNAGLRPVILPSINFVQFAKEKEGKLTAKANK